MNGSLSLYAAPAVEPVSVADVKAQLRIDHSDEDDLLAGLITAARLHVEQGILRAALVSQTWDYTLDTWPAGVLHLPRPPLISVSSVTYTDDDGGSGTVTATNYQVVASKHSSMPGRLALTSSGTWPSVTLRDMAGVTIRFVAGFGTAAADVPQPIRQAILLVIGDLYENRENSLIGQGLTVMPLPFAARMLLQPYRNRRSL